MSLRFRCFAYRSRQSWEAICADLDIAVFGDTINEVIASLEICIQMQRGYPSCRRASRTTSSFDGLHGMCGAGGRYMANPAARQRGARSEIHCRSHSCVASVSSDQLRSRKARVVVRATPLLGGTNRRSAGAQRRPRPQSRRQATDSPSSSTCGCVDAQRRPGP